MKKHDILVRVCSHIFKWYSDSSSSTLNVSNITKNCFLSFFSQNFFCDFEKIKIVEQLSSEVSWLGLSKPYCILLILKKRKSSPIWALLPEILMKKEETGVSESDLCLKETREWRVLCKQNFVNSVSKEVTF